MTSLSESASATTVASSTDLPLVSVGVPTYNRPEGLRRALEDITTQTYPNLEIIVSDNASPGDQVEKVVRAFMTRDRRIQYFRQSENRGAVYNFQFVLERATGEFFVWAADDDWRAPVFIERLVGMLREHPHAALAFCDLQAVDVNGVNASPPWPDHCRYLEKFTTSNSFLRCSRYLFQPEIYGKANMIYGVYRRADLEWLNWREFVDRHGEFGADILVLFKMIQDRPPVLSREMLYKYTVDNVKYYYPGKSRRTIAQLIVRFVKLVGRQWKYLSQHFYLSSSNILKLVVMIFIPWKLSLLLWEDLGNVVRYVDRNFAFKP